MALKVKDGYNMILKRISQYDTVQKCVGIYYVSPDGGDKKRLAILAVSRNMTTGLHHILITNSVMVQP